MSFYTADDLPEGLSWLPDAWNRQLEENSALKADNKRLRQNNLDILGDRDYIKQLEKELGALLEQYCDDCAHENYCAVLAAAYEEFSDLGEGGKDFSCNRWKER